MSLVEHMADGRLEGIVLKDRTSIYRDGTRAGWSKVKDPELGTSATRGGSTGADIEPPPTRGGPLGPPADIDEVAGVARDPVLAVSGTDHMDEQSSVPSTRGGDPAAIGRPGN